MDKEEVLARAIILYNRDKEKNWDSIVDRNGKLTMPALLRIYEMSEETREACIQMLEDNGVASRSAVLQMINSKRIADDFKPGRVYCESVGMSDHRLDNYNPQYTHIRKYFFEDAQ